MGFILRILEQAGKGACLTLGDGPFGDLQGKSVFVLRRKKLGEPYSGEMAACLRTMNLHFVCLSSLSVNSPVRQDPKEQQI